MATFEAEAYRLLDSSLSDNSKRAYTQAISSFEKFRHEFHLPHVWPVPTQHLFRYIGFMSLQGRAASTVSQHIAAISRSHKLQLCVDSTDNFIVRKMLQGMRINSHVSDGRLPITITILSRLVQALPAVCYSTFETKLFSGIFTLAFFAFLRVSEIVKTNTSPRKGLKLHDLSLGASSLELRVRFSKTDQTGCGHNLCITNNSNPQICPVSAVSDYLKLRPVSDSTDYLFIHLNGKAVTRSQFTSVLTNALKFAGLYQAGYNTHSFRIGAATTAAMMGIPSELIKEWGRWKSDAFKRYIRISLNEGR